MLPASSRLAAFAACLAVGVAVACKGREGGAGATTGATGAPAMGAPNATATPPAAPAMTDGNIVALFDEANIADSASAAMALPKATNAEVKAFARMMMGEHHGLRVKAQQYAKKPTGAMEPWPKAEPPATDPFQSAVEDERRALEATAKGRAFDSTYIAKEIGIHQAVMDWATQALAQAQNKELKELLSASAPVIQRHLDRAKAIEQKLGAQGTMGAKTKS